MSRLSPRLLLSLLLVPLVGCIELDKGDDDDDDDEEEESDDTGWDADDSGWADADTDTDSDTDTDTDTDSDTDTDTDTDADFEPTFLLIATDGAIDGGSLTEWVYDSTSYPLLYQVILIDDNWSGVGDTDNACVTTFAVSSSDATEDSDFAAAGAWLGWSFDADQTWLQTEGRCSDLDIEDWGDPDTMFSGMTFGWGVGPLDTSTDMGDALYDAVDDAGLDWAAEWEPYVLAGYAGTTLSGDWEVGELDYTFAFEMDDYGTLIDDGAGTLNQLDVSSWAGASYGYYRSVPFFGFGL